MKIRDIIHYLESVAPPMLQESYDNAGLITGNPQQEAKAALIALDVTEAVVDDAIAQGANLIIAHHPIVFRALKTFTGKTYVERVVIKAIKHDIAIYAAHTNLDSVHGGVNTKICNKIGLVDCRILSPVANYLRKLVTFVPEAQAEQIREAVFAAGAGHIGNYDQCSFTTSGSGTFRGNESTNPFVGTPSVAHTEPEVRIETVFPKHAERAVVQALLKAHPYEEVAYDIYALENNFAQAGAGMIGRLAEPEDELSFLRRIKEIFGSGAVRHTPLLGKPVTTVALCGGSGSFLLNKAIAQGADVFVSGDFTYHQFFDTENRIVIADIGHYESEQFTKEVFYELITKKFPTFAIRISEVNTNPINYL